MTQFSRKTQKVIDKLKEVTSEPYPVDEKDLDNMPLGLLYSRFLMASYTYYILDEESRWSDNQYDKVCKRLQDEWDNFEHRHKYLVRQEELSAGTAYFIREKEYPTIVKCSAYQWNNKHWEDL